MSNRLNAAPHMRQPSPPIRRAVGTPGRSGWGTFEYVLAACFAAQLICMVPFYAAPPFWIAAMMRPPV